MFAKKNRLVCKSDFQRVFKLGKGIKNSFLYIKILQNDKNTPRIGIVVSKEISNKSVQRNKIRRVLREALKQNIESIPSFDLVVVVLPEIKKQIKNIKGIKIGDVSDLIAEFVRKIKI